MQWHLVAYYSVLVMGSLIGAIRFRRLSVSSRYFCVLLMITGLNELLAQYAATVYDNNLPVYRFFAFVQVGLVGLGYSQELPRLRNWIKGTVGLIVAIGIADILLNLSDWQAEYHTLVKSLCSIFIIVLSLTYFKALLNQRAFFSFTEYPLFWLSVGWLLFSVTTLFNFSAFNYINSHSKEFAMLFQYIRIAVNIILYSLFIVAFYTKQRSIET